VLFVCSNLIEVENSQIALEERHGTCEMQIKVQLLVDVKFKIENVLFFYGEFPFLSNQTDHSVVRRLDRLLKLSCQ